MVGPAPQPALVGEHPDEGADRAHGAQGRDEDLLGEVGTRLVLLGGVREEVRAGPADGRYPRGVAEEKAFTFATMGFDKTEKAVRGTSIATKDTPASR